MEVTKINDKPVGEILQVDPDKPYYRNGDTEKDCDSGIHPKFPSYPEVFGEDFGTALDLMKSGKAMARKGWNGKNMYVYLVKGSVERNPNQDAPVYVRGISNKLFDSGDTGTVTRLPNFNMKLADGCVLTGWIPTQTDLLSEDWSIVDLTPTGDVNNG